MQSKTLKQAIMTTGDLRQFLARIAVAVAQSDMKVAEAIVAIKACEQINASLYSEIKSASLALAAGNLAPRLGHMPLDEAGTDIVTTKAAT